MVAIAVLTTSPLRLTTISTVRPLPVRPLPHRCSTERRPTPIDRDLLRTRRTAVGAFRCRVEHQSFRDSGPIRECIVVFPRSTVWIRHEGTKAFLADPTVVTLYNRGQVYDRLPASPEGDRCDWFAVSDDVAREIAGSFNPVDGESERPFRFAVGPSSAELYLWQRALIRRAAAGRLDALALDEVVMDVVSSVLRLAYGHTAHPLARRAAASLRHRDLTEAAKAELAREPHRNTSVHDVAVAVGASAYHLCRVFRACTGMTMHAYRRELRVRLALEPLGGEDGGAASLSSVAHRFGFASHAHFVLATRECLGRTPSAVRDALGDQEVRASSAARTGRRSA